ncbi:hypothetical protein ACFXPW_11765 [Streptomyces goshikiensis]
MIWLLAFACGIAAGLVVIVAQELRHETRMRAPRCMTCGGQHRMHATHK